MRRFKSFRKVIALLILLPLTFFMLQGCNDDDGDDAIYAAADEIDSQTDEAVLYDEYGNAYNSEGNSIAPPILYDEEGNVYDSEGNPLDEDGNAITPTYLYDDAGNIYDSSGNLLEYDEDGNLVMADSSEDTDTEDTDTEVTEGDEDDSEADDSTTTKHLVVHVVRPPRPGRPPLIIHRVIMPKRVWDLDTGNEG